MIRRLPAKRPNQNQNQGLVRLVLAVASRHITEPEEGALETPPAICELSNRG